ncbi:MAG: Asp23/Gls24 family envelope stress response protein [Thermoflexales bacterium]|nr:Asp23/Gls24 family envelope stress response protein [Thermoflexales bacterium]MCX7939956.1 Asp23/Gls24 family envelope stress response protein [Thermoflexales bacterium]MDW8292001.1 Asp23/Gls24 family envelope stress response protein [Anaerolineae bacterium]
MTNSTVTIAPEVIRTVVRNTVLALSNVRRIARHRAWRGSDESRGVEVSVHEGQVHIKLHVVAAIDAPLVELGRTIQREVKTVVEEIVGLQVARVDVHFEDVAA